MEHARKSDSEVLLQMPNENLQTTVAITMVNNQISRTVNSCDMPLGMFSGAHQSLTERLVIMECFPCSEKPLAKQWLTGRGSQKSTDCSVVFGCTKCEKNLRA